MKKIILVFLYPIVIILSCGQQSQNKNLLSFEEGFIQVDPGVRIFYQKVGSGKQVTIIPAGWWLYDDFKQLANNDRTLIFFDLRNRGRSDFIKDSTLIDIEREIEDIEAIRKNFNAEKINLVGWSYLGLLVMLYADKYPNNIESVIQIGPVPIKWDKAYPDSLRNVEKIPELEMAGKYLDSLRATKYNDKESEKFNRMLWDTLIRKQLVGNIKDVHKLGSQWGDHVKYPNEWEINFIRHLKFHFGTIQKLNLNANRFSDIQQKVLVIHGTKDRNAPFGSGKEWASILPNSKLLRVDGAAHVPWADYPDIVFPAIDSFLK